MLHQRIDRRGETEVHRPQHPVRPGIPPGEFLATRISLTAVLVHIDLQLRKVLSDAAEALLEQVVALIRHDQHCEGPPGPREGHAAVRALQISPIHLPNHAITCFPRIEARVDHLTGPITMLATR